MSEHPELGWLYATSRLGIPEQLQVIGLLVPFLGLALLAPKSRILAFFYGAFILVPAFYALGLNKLPRILDEMNKRLRLRFSVK